MTTKRDPSKAVQVGFLVLLAISAATAAYWIGESILYTRAVGERFAAIYADASVGQLTAAFPELAESTRDVADAVALCAQHKVPVIPFGVGSSLEGHLLAVRGGISIDVSRMNQVLAINAEDLTVTVQPGVTRKAVNEAVKS